MLKVDVSLRNMDALDIQIKELNAAIDANLLKVANYARDEAKFRHDYVNRTGNLEVSTRRRKSKFEYGGYIVIASGSHRSKTLKGFHAHLVEFGHVKFLWGKPTNERVEPKPFMRPAKEKSVRYAIQLFRAASQRRGI